jgi:hypothetical protein
MLPWLKYFTRGRIGRNLLLFWKGEGETNYLRGRDRLGFGRLLKGFAVSDKAVTSIYYRLSLRESDFELSR